MKFLLVCDSKDHYCGDEAWIRGHFEIDTNAVVLDDNDDKWTEVCEHIGAGDYYIKEQDTDEEQQ